MMPRWLVVLVSSLSLGASAGCGARSSLDEDARPVASSVGSAGAGGASGSPGTSGTAAAGKGGGGRAGSGGAAGVAGSAGAAGERPCPPLIDDMENGTGFILPCAGRAGAWYSYNDGFGVQVPPPTAAGVPLLPSPINLRRGPSSRAMFSSYALPVRPPVYNPSTNWGAGIGVDLNFDGVRYGSYDASAYQGITFWARGTTNNGAVRVSTIATTLVAYGGTCPMEFCAPAEGFFATQADWQQYFIPFNKLVWSMPDSHEPLGDAFRKDQLTNIQFLYTMNDYESDSEFWVDDLAFYVTQP